MIHASASQFLSPKWVVKAPDWPCSVRQLTSTEQNWCWCVTEIKVETQAFICFSHRLWVNCYLNLDPRDLLWLSLGLAQEDTLHGALDHLDQNHKVLEMSQERMFTTDFQTVGMSSSVIIRKNMMPLKEVSKPQKLRRTETMFDLVPI